MRRTNLATLAAIVTVVSAAPAMAQYTAIQHNLFDGVGDTSFADVGGGVFELNVESTTSDLVSLLDGGPVTLPGTVTNAVFTLTSTFNAIVGSQAQFVGGSLGLTFDYDDGGGALPYEISGPITGLLFNTPQQQGPIWRIDGLGRWTATTKNLPGSGVWPDGGGFSSLDTFSLFFDDNLGAFDWASDLTGRAETQYQLFPNDSAVPEPATLALLAIGSLGLIRRRR